MSVPTLAVQSNGVGVISGDNANTFVQGGALLANLRAFTGLNNMSVWLVGTTTAGDGGQGMFVWNSNSTATDDGGVTAIVPTSQSVGAWLRQSQGGATKTASSGSTLTITSGSPLTLATLQLTPGTWAITGIVDYVPGATTTIAALLLGLNETPNTLNNAFAVQVFNLTFTTGASQTITSGVGVLTLNSTTNVYLVAQANFAVSTMTASGAITAVMI